MKCGQPAEDFCRYQERQSGSDQPIPDRCSGWKTGDHETDKREH